MSIQRRFGARIQMYNHTGRNLGIDIKVLSGATVFLWLISFVWLYFDISHAFDNAHVSESEVWFLALSGLIFIPLIIAGIVAVWGVVLGIPTCLLAIHLVLRNFSASRRWPIAGLITAAFFISPPLLLNNIEQQRLAARYMAQDTRQMPVLVGRAIELPEDKPMPVTWQGQLSCSSYCLDLMTFAKARSVTRSFPGSDGPAQVSPFNQTFRVGSRNGGCNGDAFQNSCAKIVDETIPSDRLVLRIKTVEPESVDAKSVTIRRLTLQDTRAPIASVATLTSFVFGHYPGLLNIAWDGHGFYLPRNKPPIFVQDDIDATLYRQIIPNTLDGKYYPFR